MPWLSDGRRALLEDRARSCRPRSFAGARRRRRAMRCGPCPRRRARPTSGMSSGGGALDIDLAGRGERSRRGARPGDGISPVKAEVLLRNLVARRDPSPGSRTPSAGRRGSSHGGRPRARDSRLRHLRRRGASAEGRRSFRLRGAGAFRRGRAVRQALSDDFAKRHAIGRQIDAAAWRATSSMRTTVRLLRYPAGARNDRGALRRDARRPETPPPRSNGPGAAGEAAPAIRRTSKSVCWRISRRNGSS